MQKRKTNTFSEKFRLLNSQEHTEEISWSSTSSSEYEDTAHHDRLYSTNETRVRKRKRRKKPMKNISNLQVTIIDAPKDSKGDVVREKSPILCKKTVELKSPILAPLHKVYKKSPILSTKTVQRSPILNSKYSSPKSSSKVKKNLFKIEEKQCDENSSKEFCSQTSCDISQDIDSHRPNIKKEIILDTESENSKLSNSSNSQEAKLRLVRNVQHFFSSAFSSDLASQHISDTPSPEESSKSEELDILSCKTQINSVQPTITHANSLENPNKYEKRRKVKYKKGGLAYRLNALLKKQTANISLWQHERFLAGTSNFVIPKGSYSVFYVKDIFFKYDCYLIYAFSVNDERYYILINNLYVSKNIERDSVIKIYEPYKVLEYVDKHKLLINACKFESVDLRNL